MHSYKSCSNVVSSLLVIVDRCVKGYIHVWVSCSLITKWLRLQSGWMLFWIILGKKFLQNFISIRDGPEKVLFNMGRKYASKGSKVGVTDSDWQGWSMHVSCTKFTIKLYTHAWACDPHYIILTLQYYIILSRFYSSVTSSGGRRSTLVQFSFSILLSNIGFWP